MKNTALLYGLVGFVTGGSLIGVLLMPNGLLNHSSKAMGMMMNQEQMNPHHSTSNGLLNHSSTAMGMMMNQEQMDQHFIEMMIPHHQGAIDMANLALTEAKHPELKKLAEAIKTSQTKEIETMKEWYKKWYGVDVPKIDMNHQMPMMGMMDMMSMMNMDLTALKNSPNFDLTFVDMMIPHHKMAVMMAAMVLDSPHPELRNLAKAIIQTQSAEIEEMLQWQKAWSK